MADTQAPPAKAGGGKAFWTHKLGPFPVYVWAIGVVAVGGYYWYTHYGPGASKSQSGQQGSGQGQGKQRTPPTRITETIRVYERRGRSRFRGVRPAGSPGAAGTAAQAAAAGVPAQYGGGPGAGGTMAGIPAPPPVGTTGPGPDRDRDKDKRKRDRDKRRRVAVGSQETTIRSQQQTGQPVDPDTGQPVYWEWTHAHRGPEISHPVPEPQQAYAPMTNGATYDAASASTAADALAG